MKCVFLEQTVLILKFKKVQATITKNKVSMNGLDMLL